MAQVLRHVPIVDDARVLADASSRDDAAVYRLAPDRAIVATVDFFAPIVDDPYWFGRIAAANALSDLYAMGASPLFALNLVGWPRDPEMLAVLGDVLRGGSDAVREAGVFVLGGHSVDDAEPKYGMVAIGEAHPDALLTNDGARAGDRLVLTKPLGTGVLSTALKRDAIDEAAMGPAVESMAALNAAAAAAMRDLGDAVHAATDVTGFGLLGHLRNVLVASECGARIAVKSLPVFEGVYQLIETGFVPGGTGRNRDATEPFTHYGEAVTEADRIIVNDAQTSGGILMAVAPESADMLVEALRKANTTAAADIGTVTDGEPGSVEVVG